jgi:basic amino acid/polyamine antiporter, APA family
VTPSSRPDEGLVRGIGVWTLAANTVNMSMGAGIFVLPAVVAAGMGAAALLAYGVCAVAIGLVGLCHVECGSRVTSSGGPAAYVGAAFGPFSQFVVGTLLWLAWGATSDAAVSAAFVGIAAQVAPALQGAVGRSLFMAVVLGGLAWINIRGVRSGARFAAVLTVVKIAPLVAFIVVGLRGIDAGHLRGLTHTTSSQLGATSLVLFFAFCGMETSLAPGAEIARPARTIPAAIFVALLGILATYGGVQFVAQGVLGDALAQATGAPLAETARRLVGPIGGSVMMGAGALSMFGCLAGDLLATPRTMFRLAADGQLPAVFARVHTRYRTPWAAIVAYATVAFVLASSSNFEALASAASAAILLVYASVALATLRLRRGGVVNDLPPFVIPGGWTVPILAFATALWLLAYTPRDQAIGLAALTTCIAAVYAVSMAVRARAGAVAPTGNAGTG